MYNIIRKLKLWWFKRSYASHIDVYNMMKEMLENGVDMTQCVSKIIAGKRVFGGDKYPMYAAMSQCYKNLADGRHDAMFSKSMKEFINDDEFMVLFASEENGVLESGLDDVVVMMEAKMEISSTIKNAMALPIIMIAISVFILNLLASDIIPLMEGMVPVNQWKAPGTILYHMSNVVVNYGFVILGVMGSIFTAFRYFSPTLTHPTIRPILDKLPLFSEYKQIQANSLLTAISAMLAGGTSFSSALKTLQRYSNPYMRTYINKAIAIQSQGGTTGGNGDCLDVGLFDNDASFSIMIYADLSDFNVSIHKISTRATKRLVSSIKVKMTTFGNSMSAIVMLIIPLMMGMINDFNGAVRLALS